MTKRNWKRVRAQDQQSAIRLCLDYALEHHNRSVARVAELMGTSEWAIYKWMSKGSMPSHQIRPFEYACDPQGRSTFLTQYIATSARKLVIDIPTGRRSAEIEVADMQVAAGDAVAILMRFYRGSADGGETTAALTRLIEGAAWHRDNVAKTAAPELGLFEEVDE